MRPRSFQSNVGDVRFLERVIEASTAVEQGGYKEIS
jgi:hypothetical protein